MTRKISLAIASASILVAIFAVRPHATPGPYLRDFEAYWSAGATWNARADPYARAVWSAERTVPGVDPSRDELLPFVGPPPTLPLWSLAARVPYGVAAIAWSAVLALAVLLLVATSVTGSGRRNVIGFIAALALAISWGPLTSDVALGQVALPAFAAAALVALVAASLPALGAIASCVAFAQPNASLGLVAQLGFNRTTLALALGVVLTYAFGALASGLAWPIHYAATLRAHAAAERFAAIQLTPASIAFGLGIPPAIANAVGVLAALLAVAAAVPIAMRVRDRFARFAALSALSPFVTGFVHEHDLIVAYAAAAWCGLRTGGAGRLLALAGTLLVSVDWLGLAQRPSGLAQSALLALGACGAFIALGERAGTRGTLAVGAAFAALFAAASAMAIAHPAPVWPDALGAFHASPTVTAAGVWSDEQRAVGLLAAVPAWALLRSLPLAGCALLAWAICRRPSRCRTA
ncbi:MAG TPA: hypothetical protein VFE16_11520 [Candidatus Cybelea sp.]|nr:hypothetical protein [Candidatus Cybelea sp.]